MSLRRSSRVTRPPVTLKDFDLPTDPEASGQARAIREELDHVESLLESLTPEAGRRSASSVSKPRGLTPETERRLSSDVLRLQNENLKLELELTRAKIDLARTQSEVTQNTQSKMAAAPALAHGDTGGNTPQQGRIAAQRSFIPSLKTLQTDPAVQEDLKTLEESLGDPILLGLSEDIADPAQQLLEPRTSLRGKRPLLIPDFVSSLPVVLEEDREAVLGASGGTQIIVKTNNQKKPPLASITFAQWSAANFRIMHTLIKDGDLSSTSAVINYISYSTKVSELAKIYPIPRVVQYDDLYRRMQFASGCKWGTESQFLYQQSLNKPDATQPGSTKQMGRPTNRTAPTINPATGKQVCYDFQRRQGCSYGPSCKYDHVCIKPQCLGDHPQWRHQSPSTPHPQA